MPTPHKRETRPFDPQDRDRLDQHAKPQVFIQPGMRGGATVLMEGDFWRYVKLFGFLAIVFITFTRFATSDAHGFHIVFLAIVLEVAALWISVKGTAKRIELVEANDFADAEDFKRQARLMHIAEMIAGSVWVLWVAFSFGLFDWLLVSLIVAAALWAIRIRLKLIKMSRPRNVWEK